MADAGISVVIAPARRRWLADCSAAIAASALLAAMPALAAVAGASAGTHVRTLLVVGDSLSAEFGLQRGTGWVALLQQRLAHDRPGITVVNASISGDTTAGGLARLPALLAQHHPDIVLLELGGNDALRGLPIDTSTANLEAMARLAKASGARVVVLGMQVPPNYGRSYGDRFAGMFVAVAQHEGAALVPFMLKGIADVPQADSLFQADRIHPLAIAHPTILANVWPVLAPLLK